MAISAINKPDRMTAARRDSRVYFPNLDGLRTIAFLMVYAQHGFYEPLKGLFPAVTGLGWAGVSFFFVLSGFLITYLILTEIDQRGRLDVRDFYLRRALRIWPLYYAVLFFDFIVYPLAKQAAGFSPHIEVGSPRYYVAFLGNFDVIRMGQGHGAMISNITWSVAIEEQFYVVWPLLFALLPARFYKFVFPAVILGSSVFRSCHAADSMVLYFHSCSVISDMAIGGLAAYLSIRSSGFLRAITRLPRLAIAAIYLAILAVLCGPAIALPASAAVPSAVQASLLAGADRLFTGFLFALVVLEQNFSERSLWKVGRARLLTRLGKYTYGLYLLHPIALLILMDGCKILGWSDKEWWPSLWIGVFGLFLTVGLSLASYHGYELRFLRLKRRFAHIDSSAG